MAMKLEMVLGVPASFWMNRERRYREYCAREKEREELEEQSEWLSNFPINDMIKKGWIRKYKDKADQLAEVLSFFRVASPQQWEQVWYEPQAEYRKSKSFENHPFASSAWLRRGEVVAAQIDCQPYDKSTFFSALQEIRSLTRVDVEEFQTESVRLSAEAGVALVFVPPVKGTRVFGITRWLDKDKALIQLSLRCSWEDIAWFTLFHEAAHILKHGKRDVFVEDDTEKNEKEREADEFAGDFLLPPQDYKDFVDRTLRFTTDSIKAFAEKLDVSLAVVVGRLQHDKYVQKNSRLNKLRRRFKFTQES
jgi:hypothetical protein